MRVAMTTEMSAAVMATTVPAAMTTAMSATMASFGQRRARQHAGHGHRGNSNDRSHHRILPQNHAIEAPELGGNWNRQNCRKFPTRGPALALRRLRCAEGLGLRHDLAGI
jgi:hypothetical protein